MGYIVDHEMIKLWNIYKPMIYLKNGLYRRPYFRSNVDQYTKPSQKKKFKVARKAGYDAALSLLCVYIVDLKQT